MIIKLIFYCAILICTPIASVLLGYALSNAIAEWGYKRRIFLKDSGRIEIFIFIFGIMCLYRTTNVLIWLIMFNIPMIVQGIFADTLFGIRQGTENTWISRIIWVIDISLILSTFLLCLKPIYKLNWGDSEILKNNRISFLYLMILTWIIVYLLTTIFYRNTKINMVILFSLGTLLFLAVIMKHLWEYSYANLVRISIWDLFSDQVILFNIGILFIISALFYAMLGKGWGTILNVLIYSFLFFSNYLKIRYHATIFTWLDLLQIKEFVLIGREFLTPSIIAIGITAIVVLAVLCIRFRRKIKQLLQFHISIASSLILLVLLSSIYTRISGGQYEYLDIYKRTWENEVVNVRLNGLIVNLVLNFNALQEIIMDEPEEYGQDRANELLAQFQDLKEDVGTAEIMPDIILILGESLFDFDGVDGLQFDVDIDETIDIYSSSDMLSPRYGGYTSAMEFEALTGLTLAFMPPSLTPFTTYFNNPDDEFPSIVWEFKRNGYTTKAIHPDLPDFYNRTTVYKNMGFDEYQAINSFTKTEENTTLNGWIMDDELGNRILDELGKSDQPQFIYAVTMEEHYVNTEKYENSFVHITSEQLNDADLDILSQQATSYYHTDQMIKKIIDYMDTTNRPTLLYVFGDHLPPLEALSQLGYIDDLQNKYKTTLLMYSNFKQISTGVPYITPNQIATQIIRDANVEHHSYFDYLFSLRDSYPVIHQEFTDIVENSDMDIYRFIQYDILFGNRYLYN